MEISFFPYFSVDLEFYCSYYGVSAPFVKIMLLRSPYKQKRMFCVSTSAMVPRLNPGDVVLVDKEIDKKHLNGKVIVFKFKSKINIRRMFIKGNKIILKPENPSYQSGIIDFNKKDFLILGTVEGVFMSL